MKNLIKFIFIFTLIISTTFIKSSTKDLEDKIFNFQEDVGLLKEELQVLKLEHDYLTSPQKLLEYKYMYFEDDLKQLKLENLSTIYINNNNFLIDKFNFSKNEK